MKRSKLLLLLPVALLMVACGTSSSEDLSNDPTTQDPTVDTTTQDSIVETTSEDPTSDTTPDETSEDTSTTIEIPLVDVTVSVNVVGIDTYEGNHSKIWINSPYAPGGSATTWTSAVLTQDTEDANVWTYVFAGIEADQLISFNTYYGGETESTIEWTAGINAEGTSAAPRSILVEEGMTTQYITSTFTVPSSDDLRDVKVIITPQIIEENGGEAKAIANSNSVYAWVGAAGTVEFTREEDGTFSYTVENAVIGTETLQITPLVDVAGKSSPSWTYQIGAWESGAWVTWSTGIKLTVPAEGDITTTATFNGQPTPVVEGDVILTFALVYTWEEGYTSEKLVLNGDWITPSAWNENGYYASYSITNPVVGTEYSFYWYSYNGADAPIKDAEGNNFTHTATAESTTVVVTGQFSAGVGTLTIA